MSPSCSKLNGIALKFELMKGELREKLWLAEQERLQQLYRQPTSAIWQDQL